MGSAEFSEKKYIFKRKVKAFFRGLVYYACWIFPIQKNKIVMWTFEGKGGYGCSPRYIAEELLRRNKAGKTNFEIVWLVSDMSKDFPKEIKRVKSTLWSRAYHLSTARFWVANTRTFYGTKKRKGTTYLQTWHGTVALKPIGKFRGDNLPKMAYLVSEYDSKMIDYALSGSKWCTEMWPDGLIYQGEILETGTPRCDVLLNGVEEKHIQLRQEYNIPTEAKIILYAPTFRGGSQNKSRSVNAEECTIDFEKLIETLEMRFGGKWYVFLRLHPQLAAQMKEMPIKKNSERLIDVSQRPDMNEIQAASDAIITDYSTAIFEGFLTGQYGFIYADDLKDYIADRGKLMFSMEKIPFSVACDSNELMENILKFDEKKYVESVKQFIQEVGILEDGHASDRVVDLMEQLL